MDEISLDTSVALRMGLDEAVAAHALEGSGITIEFALVPPSSDRGENQWTIVIHFDCDPENPDQGTSGVEPCGSDRNAAEASYLARIRDTELDLARDAGLRHPR